MSRPKKVTFVTGGRASSAVGNGGSGVEKATAAAATTNTRGRTEKGVVKPNMSKVRVRKEEGGAKGGVKKRSGFKAGDRVRVGSGIVKKKGVQKRTPTLGDKVLGAVEVAVGTLTGRVGKKVSFSILLFVSGLSYLGIGVGWGGLGWKYSVSFHYCCSPETQPMVF